MIKFLINFASFLLCVGILAFSGYKTITENNAEEMINKFETAFEGDFINPEQPGNDGESNKPSEDNGSSDDENKAPEQGGDSESDNEDEVGGDDSAETDPSAKPTLSTEDAKNAFGSFYDNSDPTFNDMNKEFFTSMLSGLLGKLNGDSDSGSDTTPPDVNEGDFNDSFDGNFGTGFNPDEFEPEEDPEDDSAPELSDYVVGVAGTYYENLQAAIQEHQQANTAGTPEEQQAARDEFIERESEAFAGVVNVLTKSDEASDEELVQSVDAVLNSTVCLNTVTESIENDEKMSDQVKEATADMDESSKDEIKAKLDEALEANPENEEQYNYLADLFGITLGGASAE